MTRNLGFAMTVQKAVAALFKYTIGAFNKLTIELKRPKTGTMYVAAWPKQWWLSSSGVWSWSMGLGTVCFCGSTPFVTWGLPGLAVWSCLTQVSAGYAGFCAAQYVDDTSVVLLIALFLPGFQALLCSSKELWTFVWILKCKQCFAAVGEQCSLSSSCGTWETQVKRFHIMRLLMQVSSSPKPPGRVEKFVQVMCRIQQQKRSLITASGVTALRQGSFLAHGF